MATTADDIELGSDKGGGSQHGYPACPVASPKEQWQQWEDQKEQQTVRFAIVCLATTGWRGLRVFRVFAWFAAIGLLIWEVVAKLTKPGDLMVSTTRLLDATIGPAVACVLVALVATVTVAWRLLAAAQHNEPWGREPIRGFAWMGGMQLTLWNLLFFLYILQAMKLLPADSWLPLFKPFNPCQEPASKSIGRFASDADTTTAPDDPCELQGHFMKRMVQCGVCALIWLPTQGLVYAAMNQAINAAPKTRQEVYGYGYGNGPSQLVFISNDAAVCAGFAWPSLATDSAIRVVGALVAMLIVLSVVFGVFIRVALKQLGDWRRPYCDYRVQNLAVRLVMRTRLTPFIISIASAVGAWFVHPASYNSYVQVWLGLGPMHIAMTATVVVEALLFIPHNPAEKFRKAQAQRCTVEWMEADVPAQKPAPGLVFCFETALKASYLSCLAYVACPHASKPSHPSNSTTVKGGMGLYDCVESERIGGGTRDANCLVMWGPDTLVVSFRGTVSRRNQRADLKAWQVRYQADEHHSWWDCPKVHCGFLNSWQDDTFKDRVMARIQQVLTNKQLKGRTADGAHPFRILITGHSLGALGTFHFRHANYRRSESRSSHHAMFLSSSAA